MTTHRLEREIVSELILSHVAKLRDNFLMQIEILKAQRIAEQCTDQMEEFLETIAYVYDTSGVIPELNEKVSHFNEIDDLTEAQAQTREAMRPPFWVDDTCGDVSEPAQSSTATAAVYGDLDIAEWNAQHRDWLDEKRTQEDAR